MYTLKIRKVGSSLGMILPAEILKALHLGEGDQLFGIVDKDGVRLTSYDPEFDSAVQAFERTRRKFRNAFRELA
jgi:putative addiction module antidote